MVQTEDAVNPSAQESDLFGVPGYKVQFVESAGSLMLLRPDRTSVCLFGQSMPENAIKRIALQDQRVLSMFRERLAALLVDDLPGYVNYSAGVEAEIAILRHLAQGGAIAEEFGPSGGGPGKKQKSTRGMG